MHIKLDLNRSVDGGTTTIRNGNGIVDIDSWGWVLVGVWVCTVVSAGVGVFGAIRFRRIPVLVTGVWYCLNGAVGACDRRFAGAALALGFAYPHFHLYSALTAGTITPETYTATDRDRCCEFCLLPRFVDDPDDHDHDDDRDALDG